MKKNILLLGAGKSAAWITRYFSDNINQLEINLIIADYSFEAAKALTLNQDWACAIELDITNDQKRSELIQNSDLVISLLPPQFHILAAKDALKHGKNFINASYISDEINQLKNEISHKGLSFISELGLDPGIDHISISKMLDEISQKGGKIKSLYSFCGGLAQIDQNDDNPWKYKFTWNPRNVVLAGQGTAKYLENSKLRFIPYSRLFKQIRTIEIEAEGKFDAYANRDSLHYLEAYGLKDIESILRGTLRREGFCEKWAAIIDLGLTDDSFLMDIPKDYTYAQFSASFLPEGIKPVDFLLNLGYTKQSIEALEWLGLFSEINIPQGKKSPAKILQNLLEEKWKLNKNESDHVVMYHELHYELEGKRFKKTSSLSVYGDDSKYTAMAKTVGLPLAIIAAQIIKGKFLNKGLCIPFGKDFYEIILPELKKYEIEFLEN